MKVLAIGAHFDDIELGCAGSLIKWHREGHEITAFVATTSGYNDESGRIIRDPQTALQEGRLSAQTMGVKLLTADFPTFSLEFEEALNKEVIKVLKSESPDIILTHWDEDVHHDHIALAKATTHCARQFPRLLMYCSNWYLGAECFNPRFFVDITDTIEEKVKAIEIHRSENERTNGTWVEYCRSQANVYGRKLGVKYAEGFQVVRWLQ